MLALGFAAVVNALIEGDTKLEPSRFLPWIEEGSEPEFQTAEEQIAACRVFAAAANAG